MGKGISPCCDTMDLPVSVLSHILGRQLELMSVISVDWIFKQLKNLKDDYKNIAK
jgi:hypothetical protein